MRCPETCIGWKSFDNGSPGCGGSSCSNAASAADCPGSTCASSSPDGFPLPESCILIRGNASTPLIQGGSRMRESRTYGFVRGVLGDWHPYRDKPSAKLSRLTGVWRHREWPRDSLGGGLFCDMLSSL